MFGYLWFRLAYPEQLIHSEDQNGFSVEYLLSLLVMFLLYFAYKRYFTLWRSVSKRSVLLGVYEYFVAPLICIFLPLTLSWFNQGKGVIERLGDSFGYSLVVFLVLFFLLSDLAGTNRKLIEEKYRFGVEMDSLLLSNNPPRSREDLLFFDIGYLVLPFLIYYLF